MIEQKPKEDKGFFVQFPINLISGCPDLTRDDKWVLLSLMQDHRTDGPFKLSFRSISTISGVPLSLLSSYIDKKGVKHEGIMERIERVTGYVYCQMGKEIDPTTNKTKGNTQSYITINYTKIWQDNRMYSEIKKNRPVSNTNTLFEPVHNEIKPVSNRNTSVPIQNTPVSNTNEPVSNSSIKYPPYIEKIITDIQITEERENDAFPTSSPSDDSSFTHSSSDLNLFSKGGSSPPPLAGDSSPAENDTLNLDTQSHATVKPDVLHESGATSPIAVETLDKQQETFDAQGYKNPEPSGALVDPLQQSVSTNETPPDEVGKVTQAQLLDWLKALEQEEMDGRRVRHFSVGRITGDEEAIDRLLYVVRSLDYIRDLYKIVRSQPHFSDGRIIYALNLANESVITELEARLLEQAKEIQNERMDHEQADLFGQWLVAKRGFCFENVAIDNPYMDPNIWVLCVRYDDSENDWLKIHNWWHFNHLSDWEQELYALAEARNVLEQRPQSAPVVLEVVAV